MSFDKKAYQREYMRKKREANLSGGGASESESRRSVLPKGSNGGPALPSAQNNFPVPVLAEPSEKVVGSRPTPVDTKSAVGGEARESTIPVATAKTGQLSDSRRRGTFWDKSEYPVRAAWEIAVARAQRAKRYAEKFPHLISNSDRRFQDVQWQYENEGIKAVRVKETHLVR